MKSRLSTLCIFPSIAGGLASLFTSSTAFAQAPEKIRVQSWSEVVSLVTKNNPEIQAAEANLRSANNQELVARGAYFPELSATASHTQAGAAGATGTPAPTLTDVPATYTTTLNISQNLFNGFQDSARHQQSKWAIVSSQSALQLAKARVSFDLKSTHASLRYAQAFLELSEEIIRRRQENLRLVQLRFQSGRENRGSLLLSQSHLEQARFDRLQATHALQVAHSQLTRTLGVETNAELKDDLPLTQPPARDPDFQRLALETPEVQQARAQEETATSAMGLARAGFLPTLNLVGTTGRQGEGFFPQNERWSLGVTLTIPLFRGGRDAASLRSASELHTVARRTLENLLRLQQTTLRLAYTTYVEGVARVRVDQSFLESAKLRAEIARGKYNNGLLNFDEWEIIENDLINRQKKLLESRRDRVTAEAAWEKSLGQGAIQ